VRLHASGRQPDERDEERGRHHAGHDVEDGLSRVGKRELDAVHGGARLAGGAPRARMRAERRGDGLGLRLARADLGQRVGDVGLVLTDQDRAQLGEAEAGAEVARRLREADNATFGAPEPRRDGGEPVARADARLVL
jgi:hypothetical protein